MVCIKSQLKFPREQFVFSDNRDQSHRRKHAEKPLGDVARDRGSGSESLAHQKGCEKEIAYDHEGFSGKTR